MSTFPYRLYLVTNEQSCLGRDLMEVVEAAVKGGVDLVQIREKNLGEEAFLKKTLQLKELLDQYNVPLIVNDNLQVALKSKAAGIHVGNNDITPAAILEQWSDCGILGYSLEYAEHLQRTHAALADYLALSPVFSTPTKKDTVTEWGLEGISSIRALTHKPLVAIGRVSEANAANIIKAGADCLAVVSAICSAPDPARAAEKIRNEIEKSL
ncbi:thiamine phosphate synthase [Pontibacter diazotrophicus]|uniref:Thiamine-phosphate synthase n=1 Tax=Pontibacter diazotrophicus TaxID=1400979 RepID=A0A3D8LB43_9BACT|nr:thiamine phosphate synthase [Pontibacter diazotrophicus]RDV14563.1 thiamine phosphate synthase [Pontibacter diazotrophicus]